VDRAPDLPSLLLAAQRAVAAELTASLAARGFDDVRPGHGAVFLWVDRRTGTRLGELARRAGVTKQSMMQAVDDLQARGYVRRVADPADARVTVVELTAEGRRCATEFRRAMQVLETRIRRRLGDRADEALRAALAALAGDASFGR
jgi:DNA-binding MarR family transcriptional regulator